MISGKDIEELFKEPLALLKDEKLKEQVVKAWVIGCERGSWKTIEELKTCPFTLLTPTHGVSFVEHTIAVTMGAYHLAQVQIKGYKKLPYSINMDRLIAGGLLHDVGKLLEIERADEEGKFRKSYNGRCTRHPISGAILAAEVGCGLEIQNLIANHAGEGAGRPKVIECVLIHQADFATFDPVKMMNDGLLIQ